VATALIDIVSLADFPTIGPAAKESS